MNRLHLSPPLVLACFLLAPAADAQTLQVVRSGSFVERIVVGGYTVEATELLVGRSIGDASPSTSGGYAVIAADDLNLASYFAREQMPNPVWDVVLGNWVDTNGGAPDFFLFEVGGNDAVQVQARFADGSLGAPVSFTSWTPTGYQAPAGPNAGQQVSGLAFELGALKLPDGSPVPPSAALRGLRFASPTVDGAVFATVDPDPPRSPSDCGGEIEVHGTAKKWHPVEIWFHGPWREELDDAPNPFLDFRLTVSFEGPSGQRYAVPGFFDGNGRGGGAGCVWKAVIAPDEPGTWTAVASFREGPEIALSLEPFAGSPSWFDGQGTSFEVAPLDGGEQGFYARGRLQQVGAHYLAFSEGGYFLKGGTDSPENLLAYRGFDDTQSCSCGNLGVVHSYGPHVGDWQPGDPNFRSNATGYDARGLIGALNYLSSQFVNSVYFLPMNLGGDAWDTSPFVGQENNAFDKTHFDVSKLAQWRVVFDHAARKGILLHVVLAETEWQNEQWLDGGALGRERKLFYREMVARFSHHPAIKWTLSEENDYPLWRLREFADWIGAHDPYDHPIAAHNHPNDGSMYQQMLGDGRFDATSLQYAPDSVGGQVESWRAQSAGAGHPWVVDADENNPADVGLAPWNAAELRKRSLWDVYFSGGAGVEWYAGAHALPVGGDQSLEDFRTREDMWRYTWYARKFLESYLPFWDMYPADHLVSGESGAYGGAEVFVKDQETYAVYLPSAEQGGVLDLSGVSGRFRQTWYDPRTGSFAGAPRILIAGGAYSLDLPPHSSGEDWVTLVQRVSW